MVPGCDVLYRSNFIGSRVRLRDPSGIAVLYLMPLIVVSLNGFSNIYDRMQHIQPDHHASIYFFTIHCSHPNVNTSIEERRN